MVKDRVGRVTQAFLGKEIHVGDHVRTLIDSRHGIVTRRLDESLILVALDTGFNATYYAHQLEIAWR